MQKQSKMNNNDFEHLIQSKLKDHEAEVPTNLWKSIEKELPHKNVFSMPVFFRYAAASVIIAVCSVTALLFLKQPDNNTYIVQEQHSVTPFIQKNNTDELKIRDAEVSRPNSLIARIKPATKYIQKNASSSGEILTSKETDEQNDIQKSETAISDNTTSTVSKNMNSQRRNRPKDISEEEYNRKLKEFEEAGKKSILNDSEFLTKKNTGFSIGLLASNALPGSKNMNNQPLTRSSSIMGDELNLFSTPEPLKFTHKMPISVGLTIEKKLGKHWGIESGIVYTLLRSDYKTRSLSQEGKQELHYIGVPLQAIYRFARTGNFSFYAAAGPKIDFNVGGRRTETARNGIASSNGTENIRDKKPQWSLQLRAGAAYAFIPQLELYAEPSMAYYINNKSDIPDLWKDKPLNFVFQVGLRTNF